MEAGRELDALVMEKVLGNGPKLWVAEEVHHYAEDKLPIVSRIGVSMVKHECQKLCNKLNEERGRNFVPAPEVEPYSSDMTFAWEVAETFINAGCAAWVEGDGHTGYRAGCTTGNGRFESNADTAPLAICRAALMAMGEK